MSTAIQEEALARARNGQSEANDAAVIAGFVAKGIPEEDILPRRNVFTYTGWKGLGRVVCRGQHGIKIGTWIHVPDREDRDTGEIIKGGRRPKTAVVFHISQTKEI